MAFLNQSQVSHRWWRVRRICLAGLCAWAVFSAPAAEAPPADAQQTKVEYGLKAGLMFRFAQFVVWPTRAFADAQAPIVVGVLGENPFESLDGFLSEKVDGRSFVV